MPIKFQVKLSDKDMYRFNMYHAYTSTQGILSIVVAIVILLVTYVCRDRLGTQNIVIYLAFAAIFLFYMPVSLKMRSKRQIALSDVLQGVLTYELTEEGVVVATDTSDETATLPWDMIYKVVTNKHQLLIYSNRVNAYVVPLECIADQKDAVYGVFRDKVEDYRLHLK